MEGCGLPPFFFRPSTRAIFSWTGSHTGADREDHRRPQNLRLGPMRTGIFVCLRIRDLEIDYTALSLVAPEKIVFA